MRRKRQSDSSTSPAGKTCQGTRIAYGRKTELCYDLHEAGRWVWGNCWKCGRDLGCSTCTTSNVREILCQYCAAWGTQAAFHHHGPGLNTPAQVAKRHGVVAPEFKDYPPDWRVGYEAPNLSVQSFDAVARRALDGK